MLKPYSGLDKEIAATRFAGAFLVPKSMAIAEIGEKRAQINPLELHLIGIARSYKIGNPIPEHLS